MVYRGEWNPECPEGMYSVKGYKRKDGTFVKEHCAEYPDGKISKTVRKEFPTYKDVQRRHIPDKKASEFGSEYYFVQPDYSINDVLESAGVPKKERSDFTGVFVKETSNGPYEVWATRSSRPYDVNAEYERVR